VGLGARPDDSDRTHGFGQGQQSSVVRVALGALPAQEPGDLGFQAVWSSSRAPSRATTSGSSRVGSANS
jgi:hypothetical protein